MKTQRIIYLLLLALFSTTVYAQSIDYKAKTQRLVPEADYLADANWKAIFYDEYELEAVSKYGIKKGVVIAPDESVFISDRYKYTITKLDKQGRELRTWGKKGGNPGEFVSNQDLEGILDGKYVVVSDAQGRINFFDLDGNFVKMITLDFMPLNIYPLKNGKLIIQGHVPYSTKSKKLLAELDFESEKVKQIYYTFEDYDDPRGGISMPYKDGLISIGPPFSARKSYYRVTADEKVILGINDAPTVKVFSKINGTFRESEFSMKNSPIALTEKEKEEYYENFKDQLEKKGLDVSFAEKVKEDGFFPDYLPYYYNIIVDNENNCLFFIYSNEEKDHIFQTYTTGGQYLGESEFTIDGYDLMSGLGSFTFMNGYVYTLALKKGEESPMRILKCRIVSE